MLICSPTTGECEEKVLQCVHVHDLPMHGLQTLSIDQKQTVDGNTDKIVESQKALASQVTVDRRKHLDH